MGLEVISIIGILAILTTMTRLLPQIIKGYHSKKVRDVSLAWELMGVTSAALWILYGFLLPDTVVLLGGVVQMVSYLILIHQQRIYGGVKFFGI